MRDIRNLCGADTAVYEKQTKSLIFTLELPFKMEMKDILQCFLTHF